MTPTDPPAEPTPGTFVYRHSIAARVTHWLWALALLVLVMSGLQIFNAAPYLDAYYKNDPAHRILSFQAYQLSNGATEGTVKVFGHEFDTTNVLGWTDDGQGGRAVRAFPGWITLPAEQNLADGRLWHFFFGWVLTIALAAYLISAAIRKDLRELMLRPADLPKLLPMQLYYFRLRKEPPPHGTYNPLQKAAYTVVLFVFLPLMILSGLALSPGIDAVATPLMNLFGGHQWARTWHFVIMSLLVGYFVTHMVLVFSTGPWNNVRSMITGWYRLKDHDGVGV